MKRISCALLAALGGVHSTHAQCTSTIDATQVVEYDPGINDYLPWPGQLAHAVLRQCPEASIEFMGVTLDLDEALGSSTVSQSLSFDFAAGVSEGIGVLGGDWPVPEVSFNECPLFTEEQPIAEWRGAISMYSFHIGGGYFNQRSEGSFTACDSVTVSSPVATVLEVPVHIGGSVTAAESFGDPGPTVARGTLEVEGTVAGQTVGPFSLMVESVTAIPEIGSIDETVLIQIPVGPGTTTLSYSLDGSYRATCNAKAAGFLSGAATVIVDFPNSIRLGNFRSAGGGTLPAGVSIVSDLTGMEYNANPSGTPLCSPEPNSTGVPASLEAVGSPALSDEDLTLSSADLPPGMPALYFFGPQAVQLPFGNGIRCVGAGSDQIYRFAPQAADVDGTLVRAVDFQSSPGTAITPGQQWVFQCWYRDPAAGGAFFNLSDAVALVLAP